MTDDVYTRQNFGNQVGMGRKPALLIVDFQVGFADPEVFGGGNVKEAVQATIPLLQEARALGLPVAYTRAVFADDGSDAGVFGMKVPALKRLTDDAAISQIVPELAPQPGEYIVDMGQKYADLLTADEAIAAARASIRRNEDA
jgi:maleamate amidohydrolase